eukprot:g35668.t1
MSATAKHGTGMPASQDEPSHVIRVEDVMLTEPPARCQVHLWAGKNDLWLGATMLLWRIGTEERPLRHLCEQLRSYADKGYEKAWLARLRALGLAAPLGISDWRLCAVQWDFVPLPLWQGEACRHFLQAAEEAGNALYLFKHDKDWEKQRGPGVEPRGAALVAWGGGEAAEEVQALGAKFDAFVDGACCLLRRMQDLWQLLEGLSAEMKRLMDLELRLRTPAPSWVRRRAAPSSPPAKRRKVATESDSPPRSDGSSASAGGTSSQSSSSSQSSQSSSTSAASQSSQSSSALPARAALPAPTAPVARAARTAPAATTALPAPTAPAARAATAARGAPATTTALPAPTAPAARAVPAARAAPAVPTALAVPAPLRAVEWADALRALEAGRGELTDEGRGAIDVGAGWDSVLRALLQGLAAHEDPAPPTTTEAAVRDLARKLPLERWAGAPWYAAWQGLLRSLDSLPPGKPATGLGLTFEWLDALLLAASEALAPVTLVLGRAHPGARVYRKSYAGSLGSFGPPLRVVYWGELRCAAWSQAAGIPAPDPRPLQVFASVVPEALLPGGFLGSETLGHALRLATQCALAKNKQGEVVALRALSAGAPGEADPDQGRARRGEEPVLRQPGAENELARLRKVTDRWLRLYSLALALALLSNWSAEHKGPPGRSDSLRLRTLNVCRPRLSKALEWLKAGGYSVVTHVSWLFVLQALLQALRPATVRLPQAWQELVTRSLSDLGFCYVPLHWTGPRPRETAPGAALRLLPGFGLADRALYQGRTYEYEQDIRDLLVLVCPEADRPYVVCHAFPGLRAALQAMSDERQGNSACQWWCTLLRWGQQVLVCANVPTNSDIWTYAPRGLNAPAVLLGSEYVLAHHFAPPDVPPPQGVPWYWRYWARRLLTSDAFGKSFRAQHPALAQDFDALVACLGRALSSPAAGKPRPYAEHPKRLHPWGEGLPPEDCQPPAALQAALQWAARRYPGRADFDYAGHTAALFGTPPGVRLSLPQALALKRSLPAGADGDPVCADEGFEILMSKPYLVYPSMFQLLRQGPAPRLPPAQPPTTPSEERSAYQDVVRASVGLWTGRRLHKLSASLTARLAGARPLSLSQLCHRFKDQPLASCLDTGLELRPPPAPPGPGGDPPPELFSWLGRAA